MRTLAELRQSSSTAQTISPTANLVTTTPAGAKPVAQVTWAVYRDVNSLDPAFAFDYPENTAISLMCESLLLQKPNGTIAPGLATVATPAAKTSSSPSTRRPGSGTGTRSPPRTSSTASTAR